MGLSLPTTLLAYLLYAISRARATCIIILLHSLADPDGAFDAPKSKCPPDRGSSDCVTGSLASISSASSESNHSSSSFDSASSKHSVYPPARPYDATETMSRTSFASVGPRAIPRRVESPYDLATPPLTPDDDEEEGGNQLGITTKHSKDALDLLLNIFPHNGLSILPFAKSVTVTAPNMGAAFEGVVVDLPGKSKTLYVDGKSAESVSLRESIVALLDLADEYLECSALVIVLNKSSPVLGDLLHSLMYVGGSVVTKPPFQVDPAYVLVGLEI